MIFRDGDWYKKPTGGAFLVKMKNAFVPTEGVYSVNTYLRISSVPRGSEQSEWAREWSEQAKRASEASKRSEQAKPA